MEEHLALERPHPTWNGVQKIYWFDNKYGASVVCATSDTPGMWGNTYGGEEGLWELAVIKFNGDDPLDFDLVYNTHITDDVLGRLTEEDVTKVLKQIKEL